MKMPACCQDDMDERMKGGAPKAKAMLGALAAHKAGKHEDYEKDADGDDDGDED